MLFVRPNRWKHLLFALCIAKGSVTAAEAQEFTVRRADDDSVALRGQLEEEYADRATELGVQLADFSDLEDPGEYYVDVEGLGRSVSFRIGREVYAGELVNVMLGFYGWRSGVDIEFEHDSERYRHAAGHLDDALLDYVDDQVGDQKDGTGGWYDAGDFGKYLPTAAESVCSMLAAWELFSDQLELVELPFLPEHGGELPDYLDEIKFELDWVLKMAYDDGSGRVHHKLNSPAFPGFVLPEDDPTTRYFSDYSTAATAEFVATLAKAVRAFEPYDDVTDGYSRTLLDAALTAYGYLEENPENRRYDNSVLRAGEYQKDDADDRLWAAAELWETTGDPLILEDFESRIDENTRFVPNFSWDTTQNFGLLTYVLSQREGRDEDIVQQLEEALDTTAQSLVLQHDVSGYGRSYQNFYWGSNGVIARTCMLLQAQNALDPDPELLDVCADQVAYLFGRNQYNRSQVTGSGIEPPLNPHHRISGSDEVDKPYPGLLVGGGQTATDWTDEQGDFRTNEVAINWNAALVFALAGFVDGEAASEGGLGRGPVAAESCNVRVSSVGYRPERSKIATVQADCELPSNFQCELGEQTMSGDQKGPLSMIEDVEDGDEQILTAAGRNGSWFAYDDGTGGDRTEPTVEAADRSGSRSALCIHGGGFSFFGGGFGFPLSEGESNRMLYDARGYTGVSFWAKGSANPFRLMIPDRHTDQAFGLCNSCFDPFQVTFTPNSEWRRFTFTWDEFQQLGFGDPVEAICPSALSALQFQWPANTDFELCVDDIAFTTAEGTPPEPAIPGGAFAASGGGCVCSLGTPGQPARAQVVFLACCLALLTRRTRTRRS